MIRFKYRRIKELQTNKKSVNKTNGEQLNWFWDITTKWWFFPVFWFLLSFLYGVIFDAGNLFYYDGPWALWHTFGIFILVPNGIVYWLSLPINFLSMGKFDIINLFGLNGVFVLLLVWSTFYVYVAVSIFQIVKSKNKENKILKKRILILFLLILLGFAGFILQEYYPIQAGFV